MYARLDMDILTEKLQVSVIRTSDDHGVDAPDDRDIAEHVWPAFKFQLARDGGPGPFFTPLPTPV